MIPLSRPDISALEIEYATEAVSMAELSGFGPFIDRFESEFAEAIGTTFALVTSSGTTALHLALLALDAGPGDEVLVPSESYIAVANAVTYVGATPVFVDIDPEDWCLSSDTIKQMITPRTVGMIAVDLYGCLPDYQQLRETADIHGLWIIEDAAEALFASRDHKPAGSHGDIGCFSFFGNKVLTCGEGGAVTTSDPLLHARMKQLRGQGVDPSRRYWFPVIGYNYRLSNVSAALLCAQLERRKEIVDARQNLFQSYQQELGEHPCLGIRPQKFGVVTSPWLFTLLIQDECQLSRDQVAQVLLDFGIETRPTFIALHTLPPYQDLPTPPLPVAESVAARGLSLPTFPQLTASEIGYISRCLIDAVDSAD